MHLHLIPLNEPTYTITPRQWRRRLPRARRRAWLRARLQAIGEWYLRVRGVA